MLFIVFFSCTKAQRSGVRLDSQLNKQQTENLYVLAKVWGFLKYHHPDVAKGKSSFDEELFKVMQPVTNAAEAGRRNEILLNWMNGLGDETTYAVAAALPVNNVHIKPKLNWINDKEMFNDAVIAKLNSIYIHRNGGSNTYVTLMPDITNPNFDGEEKYKDMAPGDDGLRMLALFRYWNTVEYFFPSKYLIKESWDEVLKNFIPRFAAGRTGLSYELNCLKLVNRIHDTHGSFKGNELGNYLGANYTIARARMIDGKLIVYLMIDEELGKQEAVQIGDEILTVNGKAISQCYKDVEDMLCASNPSAANRNFVSVFLLRGNGDSLPITYDHDGVVKSGSLKLYPIKTINAASVKKYYEAPMYKSLNDSIGYITLATIRTAELKNIFKTFGNAKGIVIDIRNYPAEFMAFALPGYIKPDPSPFVNFTNANINNPGLFTFKERPLSNGSKNRDYYKGKIVVLVDERSQSQAEYTAMALRSAPNAIIMGSQTAGADGDVSMIHFPGGFGSYISGLGVFYPDGRETQGIGIVPDIEVRPTQAGIKKGLDEVLERAMQYIATGK